MGEIMHDDLSEWAAQVRERDAEIAQLKAKLDESNARYELAKNALVRIERWCTVNNQVNLPVYRMACRALNEMGVTGSS